MEGALDTLDLDTTLVDDLALHSPPRKVSVGVGEDEGDEDRETYPITKVERFIEPYPGDAGQGIRKSKTRFEEWFENQKEEEKIPWDPFASEEEWALSVWLIKNVGQRSTDEFLKLPIVS